MKTQHGYIWQKDFGRWVSAVWKSLCVAPLVGTCVGCIEPFVPEPSATSRVLVVNGFITDSPGPHTVRLTRSAPIDNQVPTPEVDAEVVVTANGESYVFEETVDGVYQSQADFSGAVGTVFTLHIATAEGKEYVSNPEVLKRVPPIDSIYFETSGRYENNTGDTLTGVAIFLDTHDPENATRYYRWEWQETWEIRVPYPNTYDWVLAPIPPNPPWTNLGVVTPNDNKIGVCFDSAYSKRILIGTSQQLAADRVSKFELNYVDTRGYKLGSLYSVEVKQYALSESEFSYWSQLEKTSESLGTLFDPQPYEIRGNMYNPEDLDEAVLGYFSASAIAKKRLYIDRRELQEVKYPANECEQELVEVELRFVQDFIEAGYLIASLGPYGSIFVYMAPANCCDCTYHGTLEKPNFWPR